jgi:hypothetical protein
MSAVFFGLLYMNGFMLHLFISILFILYQFFEIIRRITIEQMSKVSYKYLNNPMNRIYRRQTYGIY